MSEQVTLYFSTISSSQAIKKAQQKVSMILEGKGIMYKVVDVAASAEDKEKMREIAKDDTALPPQIAYGDTYCGDFAAFEEAVECDELLSFLKMT